MEKIFVANNPRVNVILSYPDVKIDITYLNQGTNDERIDTITWSSESYQKAPIKAKITYIGSSGSYSISSIQYSN
jgi:phage-related protein